MIRIVFGLVIALLAGALSGCAERPGPDMLRAAAIAPPGKVVTLYVVTTRGQDRAGTFTSDRAREVSYLRFRISIPPRHKPGRIEWPGRDPNPRTEFVAIERTPLDADTFQAEVSRRGADGPPRVGVFVHGFNTNFTESVFRTAQLMTDSNLDDVPILFAWPSEGSIAGYIADKDAATYSRDQLTALLASLARQPTAGPIDLIGHSMGAWLSVEAVRQLRLTGRDDVLHRLHVTLAAPDIDVDVFRMQLAVIGPLSPPMTLLVSPDDAALRASRFLSDDRQRVGMIDVRNPRVAEAIQRAKVQVIDISQLQTPDALGHSGFASLAALYPQLSADAKSSGVDLRQTGAFVLDAAGATLSSPFTFAGRVLASP